MTTTVDIDPAGDVMLVCKAGTENEQRLRVCSAALSLGSPVFKAMLSPRYTEGQALASASPVELPLPDDGSEAMTVLCNVLHHRNAGLTPSVELQVEVAVLSDKYDCTEALQPTARCWLSQNMSTSSINHNRHLMTAAYYFRDNEAFGRHGRWLIYNACSATGPAIWDPLQDDDGHILCKVYESFEAEHLRLRTAIFTFCERKEPNEATTPEGEVLLAELGQLSPHQTYFRTHNLLTTCDPLDDDTPRLKWGCTNAYTEDSNGDPIYNWTIIDQIFDTYLERGVKPYAQIGFTPKALATDPEPYTFLFNATNTYNVIFTGWSHVPTSWQKWGELVYQWVKHEVELRGKAEVDSWYWEVWNEPNIGYWNGTEQQYFTLYDYAVANVRRALPTARVGGPEVAGGPGGDWLGLFLDHTINGTNNATGGEGAPLDFISFHAKGSPRYVNATDSEPGHLQMNVSASLQNVRDAFTLISSYPSQKDKPVVIGEDDPDGCAACVSDAYGYRNGLIYPSYTAVAFSRDLDLAMRYNINLEGTLTWAFEFQNTSYYDGFRVLATNQIDKPIMNVFRMFGKLTGERLLANSTGQLTLDAVLADSVRGEPDVGVLAAFNQTENKLAVMVWNYHDDALPKLDAQITLDVSGLGSHWQG
ncbi:hypothetical protein B0A55_11950, partial [Friedmanniomyces simplex]